MRDVSSDFSGIDRNQKQTFWLDLFLPVMREYVLPFANSAYDRDKEMTRVDATYNDISGLCDACGDMTGYCFSFYIQE